jgi:hypothetical protein
MAVKPSFPLPVLVGGIGMHDVCKGGHGVVLRRELSDVASLLCAQPFGIAGAGEPREPATGRTVAGAPPGASEELPFTADGNLRARGMEVC